MEIGDKIKQLRLQQGMTLEELGNKVGVGKSTVRKWETGFIENMRRDKIEKVAGALGVPIEYFFVDDYKVVKDEPSPAQRKLFQTLKGATDEEIEQAIKIIEALRK